MNGIKTAAFLLLLMTAGSASAQESRGSITGRVLDPQGAVIPGAIVVITDTQTNVSRQTSSNETGYFEINLLNPGTYRVSVEAAGFKKTVRPGLELSVGGRLDLQFPMELGQTTETVQVTAETPLLETTVASGGRVIDQRQISQLPFYNLNPFALATLAPGMQWTGQPEHRREFDAAGTSAFNTMGAVGQNEYSVDGAPVTGTNRRSGYVPPADAVEEFKLETTPFDASYGHTSGAIVNVTTKGGTNTYHGSLYDQHYQQRWNATQHFTRLAFEDAVRQGKKRPNEPRQESGRSNNFGASFGGPVRLPRLYNGKDKFFFFLSYHGIYEGKTHTTDAVNRTVPKLAWRQGDFSDLLAIDPVKYTIYDPRTARRVGDRVVRDPFPGNRGIPVLNPLYRFYESIYPRPNNVPGLVSPEGFTNYLASAMFDISKFNSVINRYDYNISDRHRVFGRWYWNRRLADTRDWTYETQPRLLAAGTGRINQGAGGSYVWAIGSASTLDIGVNATRFNEGETGGIRKAQVKPSDAGLPSYLNDKAGVFSMLPRIDMSGVESINTTGYPGFTTKGATGELKVTMSTVRGKHSLRYGWQERRYWFTQRDPGSSSGRFTFDNQFTRASDDTRTAGTLGHDWAAFMMGLPSAISIDTNDSAYFSTRFRSLWIQNDWRVSARFRLNSGLRYEREAGTTERFNRGVGGGFLFDAKLPFTDAAQAAYARSPLPELPASQFRVLGGTEYLGTRESTYTDGTHHFLPRAGAVYQINSKTVIRGGYGWYYDTFNVHNDRPNQFGFSQPTTTVLTNDNGLTFCCGLGDVASLSANRNPMVNPFPGRPDGTRFDAPYGNRLGAVALAGRGATFVPRNFSPAWQQRWRLGVQREIRRNMVIEVSYNGAYARIPVTQPVSFLPEQYWAQGSVRNQAVDDELNRNVPNPFNINNLLALQTSDPLIYNYLRTQSFFTSTTLRKNQLLRAFPQMNGLNGLRAGVDFSDARGKNRYHDMQLQFERRFSRGFHTAVLYTRAFDESGDYYHNEFDAEPSFRPSNLVRPNRFVWTAIWELPFGKGRQWISQGPLQHILGGWQLSWVYQYQDGPPTNWGNVFYYGGLSEIGDRFQHDSIHDKDIHTWFDPSIAYRGTGAAPGGFVGFEGRSAQQPGQFHKRVFPTRLGSLLQDGIRNWDVKILRRFRIWERLTTNFSVDMLNATNHTNFDAPVTNPTNQNFGRVTTQRGLSRVLQFNLRVDF